MAMSESIAQDAPVDSVPEHRCAQSRTDFGGLARSQPERQSASREHSVSPTPIDVVVGAARCIVNDDSCVACADRRREAFACRSRAADIGRTLDDRRKESNGGRTRTRSAAMSRLAVRCHMGVRVHPLPFANEFNSTTGRDHRRAPDPLQFVNLRCPLGKQSRRGHFHPAIDYGLTILCCSETAATCEDRAASAAWRSRKSASVRWRPPRPGRHNLDSINADDVDTRLYVITRTRLQAGTRWTPTVRSHPECQSASRKHPVPLNRIDLAVRTARRVNVDGGRVADRRHRGGEFESSSGSTPTYRTRAKRRENANTRRPLPATVAVSSSPVWHRARHRVKLLPVSHRFNPEADSENARGRHSQQFIDPRRPLSNKCHADDFRPTVEHSLAKLRPCATACAAENGTVLAAQRRYHSASVRRLPPGPPRRDLDSIPTNIADSRLDVIRRTWLQARTRWAPSVRSHPECQSASRKHPVPLNRIDLPVRPARRAVTGVRRVADTQHRCGEVESRSRAATPGCARPNRHEYGNKRRTTTYRVAVSSLAVRHRVGVRVQHTQSICT